MKLCGCGAGETCTKCNSFTMPSTSWRALSRIYDNLGHENPSSAGDADVFYIELARRAGPGDRLFVEGGQVRRFYFVDLSAYAPNERGPRLIGDHWYFYCTRAHEAAKALHAILLAQGWTRQVDLETVAKAFQEVAGAFQQ